MENLITFAFYNGQKFTFTIRIKTHDDLISKIIDRWIHKSESFLFFSQRLKLNSANANPDITLYLNRLHKKPKNFETKNSTFIFWDTIKFAPLFHNTDIKKNFILYTKKGSFVKTNIKKQIAVGRIAEGEPLALVLLGALVNCCILFQHQVALHAASMIYNEKSLILFIGKNGAGKSTICNLLSRNLNFKTINDDYIKVSPITKKISIIHNYRDYLNENTFSIAYPNYLFFINKDTSLESKITPIAKKCAFKKIIFASEFPKNENKLLKQNRLNTLARLVKQCKCYSLINGRGLKENPASFLRLLLLTIEKGRHLKNDNYALS